MIKVRVLPKKELYYNDRQYVAGDVLSMPEIPDEIKCKVKKVVKKKGKKNGSI